MIHKQINTVLLIVGQHYKVPANKILSHQRQTQLIKARWMVLWLVREVTQMRYVDMPRHLGWGHSDWIRKVVKDFNKARVGALAEECEKLLKLCMSASTTRANTKKPDSDEPDVMKTRNCLMCSKAFLSRHIGERVCKSCKETTSWRSGAAF